jgi:hypothetical protein
VLRRIIGPKRDGVTGGQRKLCNEDLRDVHSLKTIIGIIKSRRFGVGRKYSMNGVEKEECSLVVGKPTGRRLL